MKSSEVCTNYGMVTKHCNFSTKIDSPLTANCETPQKFLQWLVVMLSLKSMETDFRNDYYGLQKRKKLFFTDNLKSSIAQLIKYFKKLLPYFCYKHTQVADDKV